MHVHPISTKNCVHKVLPRTFVGYDLNSGEGWTEDLIIAYLHDIDNNVASKVHVKRFKSTGVRIEILQGTLIFSCADGSLNKESHAQRQTLRQQRIESFDTR